MINKCHWAVSAQPALCPPTLVFSSAFKPSVSHCLHHLSYFSNGKLCKHNMPSYFFPRHSFKYYFCLQFVYYFILGTYEVTSQPIFLRRAISLGDILQLISGKGNLEKSHWGRAETTHCGFSSQDLIIWCKIKSNPINSLWVTGILRSAAMYLKNK